MKKPTTPTEPLFVDKQAEGSDLVPSFVTRTTLRSILHKSRATSLEDLELNSCASSPIQSIPTDTSAKE